MPHFRIEYSANLEGRTDIGALCRVIHAAALETGVFELGAIRVRAFRADHVGETRLAVRVSVGVAVADLLEENAFIDCTVRIGQGRSEEDRKRAGSSIFAAMEAFLAPLYATPHFALTLSMDEIDGRFSWKKNGIHPRIRAQG